MVRVGVVSGVGLVVDDWGTFPGLLWTMFMWRIDDSD